MIKNELIFMAKDVLRILFQNEYENTYTHLMYNVKLI